MCKLGLVTFYFLQQLTLVHGVSQCLHPRPDVVLLTRAQSFTEQGNETVLPQKNQDSFTRTGFWTAFDYIPAGWLLQLYSRLLTKLSPFVPLSSRHKKKRYSKRKTFFCPPPKNCFSEYKSNLSIYLATKEAHLKKINSIFTIKQKLSYRKTKLLLHKHILKYNFPGKGPSLLKLDPTWEEEAMCSF